MYGYAFMAIAVPIIFLQRKEWGKKLRLKPMHTVAKLMIFRGYFFRRNIFSICIFLYDSPFVGNSVGQAGEDVWLLYMYVKLCLCLID
jgi:hypothetical protein